MGGRTHAHKSERLAGTSRWLPACKCGWAGHVVPTRARARQLVNEHRTWVARSIRHQLRKRAA